MRRWQETPPNKARIEIIPMIDVMMFLLIFFVLISLNVIPAQGIKTQLPKSSESQKISETKNIIITINNENTLQVDGKLVDLSNLSAELNSYKNLDKKLNFIINGDKSANLQTLINVMDIIKSDGFNSVAIATKSK
ncbi:MAG: ExbD/TolR family protein [Halothiobacillus sp.]